MKRSIIFPVLCWGSFPFGALSYADTPTLPAEAPPSITVTGAGDIAGQPDMARINVGVLTQSETAAEALRRNTAAVTELLAMLDEYGIADKDIQTSNFSIAAQYDYGRSVQPPRLTGYRVTNQVRVAVRRIADLGAILDEVVTAGANQISGVTFEIDEAGSIEDAARRAAMRDAYRKAALYAEEAGVRLGRVLEIVEAADAVPVRQFGFAAAQEARAVPVEPGELIVRQTVRVTYAIGAAP